MKYSSESYQEKIIGIIIRNLRKKKKISLDTLSSNLQLTPQFLSDIENGRKKLNKITINNIFNEFGIVFNWNIDPFDELPLLFSTYIHTYVSVNRERRKTYSDMIIENNQWRFSFHYPIVILTEFCSLALADIEGNFDQCTKNCEQIFDYLDNEQKAIYYYFKGLFFQVDYNNYQEAEKIYLESIRYNPFGEISGMAYYQLSNIKLDQLHHIQAFDYVSKAKNILSQFSDFKRILSCDINIGNIFLSRKNYLKMEKQYLHTLPLIQSYGDKEDLDNICFNLAYGFMISKQYEKAIYYGEKYLKEHSYKPRLHYVLAWSHFQLNHIKDCKYYLNLIECSNEKLNEEIKTYVTCLHYLIKSNYDSYYKKLVKYYHNIKSGHIDFDKMIVLERIIEYCKEHQLYEEGFKYQDEYIQLITNNSTEEDYGTY